MQDNAMSGNQVATAIRLALDWHGMEHNFGERHEVVAVQSFQEAGVLTLDDGFEITLDDGTKYQISVVRSR
jgi:hypothetical protein